MGWFSTKVENTSILSGALPKYNIIKVEKRYNDEGLRDRSGNPFLLARPSTC